MSILRLIRALWAGLEAAVASLFSRGGENPGQNEVQQAQGGGDGIEIGPMEQPQILQEALIADSRRQISALRGLGYSLHEGSFSRDLS
ncbi:hypothetical protein BC834DRAFT_389150 [Gloeopeniophorella convolvens]|nr:hypothetical protein BC834DRAFT_389150 [Gloeopeniophorella convolvens]